MQSPAAHHQSLDINEILNEKSGYRLKNLRERMRLQRCDEVLEFIIAVDKLRKYSGNKRLEKVREIKKKFIFCDLNGPYLINISEQTRNNILNTDENNEKIFEDAKSEMIYLIESDILNRDCTSDTSINKSIKELPESSDQCQMSSGTSLKRSNSKYDLLTLFHKTQRRFSLQKRRSSASTEKDKTIAKSVSIGLPNIFQHISYKITDLNDSIESVIGRLFNHYKIFSNNYEIYCNNNRVARDSKIRNFIGMHLNIEYRIIFHLILPSGKRLGLKVNAFRDVKTVVLPVLLRYGYRMKNYIFKIDGNPLAVDPDDIVTKLEGKELKMFLKANT